jgi:hypothetical protein
MPDTSIDLVLNLVIKFSFINKNWSVIEQEIAVGWVKDEVSGTAIMVFWYSSHQSSSKSTELYAQQLYLYWVWQPQPAFPKLLASSLVLLMMMMKMKWKQVWTMNLQLT